MKSWMLRQEGGQRHVSSRPKGDSEDEPIRVPAVGVKKRHSSAWKKAEGLGG